MADWRYQRSWNEEELVAELERARSLPTNFDPDAEMTPRNGWNRVYSRGVVARESKGEPESGGAFERLWHAMLRFHHSNPRIVISHFREEPRPGRPVLLELQALGLRFLCPVRIGDMTSEKTEERTLRGFSFETLDGNIESGREWFLLMKDHRTGDVRFRIEAGWRGGDFPTLWSHLGFSLIGRRYQRAWHRLSHLRLRRIAAGLDPGEDVGPQGVVHEDVQILREPVQFVAQRGLGRRGLDLEREEEDMRPDRNWRALGLGLLSGVRSMGGPALLASSLESHGRPVISGRELPFRVGPALSFLAAGEMVADKLPFTPPRIQPLSVVARAASGALVGSATARRREARLLPALVGAGSAVAATFLSYRLRALALQRSKPLGMAAALAEDALVLWAGTRLAHATTHATRRLPLRRLARVY